MPDDLAALITRAENALQGVTEGPWASYGHGVALVAGCCTCGAGGPHGHEIGCGLEGPLCTGTCPDDAHFIAASRELVPALVAALKAAQAENERLRGGAHMAIICRRHNSDLITIWSRPETLEQGAIDLQWCRDNKGGDYVFDLVTL